MQQKFNEGDQITLKYDLPWRVVSGPELITQFPKFGRVYTVDTYVEFLKGKGWFITLKELSGVIEFAEVDFVHVATRVRAMQQDREFILNLN